MTLDVTAIGNATKDGQLRTLNSGETVLNFSIARNDRRTKEVTYIECSVWGKLASSIAPYVLKGSKVYVCGELGTREWEGRTSLTCRVRTIELLGGSAGQRDSADSYAQPQQRGRSRDELDDEIPF